MRVMMGENTGLAAQSRRETADVLCPCVRCFAAADECSSLNGIASRTNNYDAMNSLHRYPSPGRPAYSPSRPMTVFRLSGAMRAVDIGYQREFSIDRSIRGIISGAATETTIGSRLCKRHQSSLRQWQYLVWQVALKVTQSVALQVQALALLPQKYLAQIAQAQCLPVLPQAFCVTTQASTAAVNVNTRPKAGRYTTMNRHRGLPPVAVFRF